MDETGVDGAILAVSMVAALLGITMAAVGRLGALAPLAIAVLGFAYVKTGLDPVLDRFGSRADGATDPEADALAVLRERYARGEIGRAEFERRLDGLLETETVEDARRYGERARGHAEDPEATERAVEE